MATIIVSTEIAGEHIDVGDLLSAPGANDDHRSRFRYDTDFIRRGYPIEPSLALDSAPHDVRGLPLSIADASPDSWGCLLLQRAEQERATIEGRPRRKLTPDEFLLGASDFTRQGALRFRGAQDSAFLADHQTLPRLLHLDTLLEAADQIAADPGTLDWEPFKRLLDVGSGALGGARPKAAVTDGDGLWIAKFPQRGDRANVPVWEMVCLDIADRAGLATPVHRLECVDGRQVLLVKRFDRDDDGRRVPYISARTLLNAQDLGSTGEYGASGIAGRLRTESADPKRDLGQLWRLAALNLLINNTDNHLRNHGFVRSGRGWSLSPAFDLEPNPDTGSTFTGTLFGGAAQRATGLRGLLAIAGDCGLDAAGARVVLDQVHQAVGGWSDDAQRYGANASEIALFEDCFTDLDDAVRAAVSSGLH